MGAAEQPSVAVWEPSRNQRPTKFPPLQSAGAALSVNLLNIKERQKPKQLKINLSRPSPHGPFGYSGLRAALTARAFATSERGRGYLPIASSPQDSRLERIPVIFRSYRERNQQICNISVGLFPSVEDVALLLRLRRINSEDLT
jgi:hypothetical protein